jgi:hypothetical protein
LARGPGFWNRNILHGVHSIDASKPFGGFEYGAQEIFDVLERISCKVVLSCDFSQQVLSVKRAKVAKAGLAASFLEVSLPYVTVAPVS